MVVEVCVGSSCFLRGSEEVVKRFQELIEAQCPGKVILKGSFCMGKCQQGVTVKINEEYFSGVQPDSVQDLFRSKILPYVNSKT